MPLFMKFVNHNLTSCMSAGSGHPVINYGPFPKEIEVSNARKSEYICGAGIHAFSVKQGMDFFYIPLTKSLIVLEAGESDVLYQGKDGCVRLGRCKALRYACPEEFQMVWNAILAQPSAAFRYADELIPGGTCQLREAASKHPHYAYVYAREVDEEGHKTTWQGVQGTQYAEYYQTKFPDFFPD